MLSAPCPARGMAAVTGRDVATAACHAARACRQPHKLLAAHTWNQTTTMNSALISAVHDVQYMCWRACKINSCLPGKVGGCRCLPGRQQHHHWHLDFKASA